MHPRELDELKALREATEACWSLMDLARLRQHRGQGGQEECDALAAAYREAEARYRTRFMEHLKGLRPDPEDAWEI
jgi:hypothetical protein